MDVRDSAKRLSLFTTAFAPAWVILLIRYAWTADASLVLLLLLALPVVAVPVVTAWKLRQAASASGNLVPMHVTKRFDITGDVAQYTLAYVPIVIFDSLTPDNLAIIFTIMAVVYFMYTRANLLHINPIISIFYRPYRVVDEHSNTVVVFAKLKVRVGTSLLCREISENLYVAVKHAG